MDITSTTTRPDSSQITTGARGAAFPPGTIARIFQPGSPRKRSGQASRQHWHLTLERLSPAIAGQPADEKPVSDPLALVDLAFPTLEAAIAHAERQGIPYFVEEHPRSRAVPAGRVDGEPALCQAFQEALSTYLLLAWWDAQYGRCAMPTSFDPDHAQDAPASIPAEAGGAMPEPGETPGRHGGDARKNLLVAARSIPPAARVAA